MSTWGPPPGVGRPDNGRPGTPLLASGKSPNRHPRIVGRDEELAEIERVLRSSRAGTTAALVLVGEPGIGKTTLLEAARALAEDHLCLTSRGAESERDLAHAGLLELLTPVRHLLPEVPEGQAAALGRALGWTTADRPADRFLVAAGTLSLLAAAAAERPVLVLVDDLQWLDPESAYAVAFAARRLTSDAVGFVLDSRPDASSRFFAGLPTRDVGPLTATQATELLPHDLAASVASRLTAATGGNPLALLEVGGRLTAAQKAGAAGLPDPLPTPGTLHRVYEETIVSLPDNLRSELLLLALDAAAAPGPGARPLLDEAVSRRIVVEEEGPLRFRHPLLRSALLRLASAADLREAHLRLAGRRQEGSPGRTRHLAAAATGPADALADALAELAASDQARSGHAAASAELERSAALTSDVHRAAERLVQAADQAFLAGDLARARTLVGAVLTDASSAETRGRACFVLGMLEQYAGSIPRAADHLADAAAGLRGAELVDALTERILVAFRLNDVAVIAECARRIDVQSDLGDPSQRLRARFAGGLADFLSSDYASAHLKLAEVVELALSEDLRQDSRSLLLMALAAGYTDVVDVALRRGLPRVEEIRERGGIGVLVPLLTLTAAAHAIVGDHARAYAEAAEAADLADCLGYVAEAAVAVEQLAWQQAARGLHDEARLHLARARALLDRAGTAADAAHHALTAAFCALCRGDLTDVVNVLEARIEADGGVGMMGEPLGVAPLLVEAYAGLGRDEEAADLTRRLADVTPTTAPATMTGLLERCRGLATRDPDQARQHLELALSVQSGQPDPFETARTRLMLGSRLRRQGQRVDARPHLESAASAFEGMGLRLWADEAAAELRATGARTGPRTGGSSAALTAQEHRVALLVAEGRSNKEVAAALFLSPRTVERHLGNVFRKRGVRTRAELVRSYVNSGAPRQ